MRNVLDMISRHADQPGWLLTESFVKELNRTVLAGILRESRGAGDYRHHQNFLLDGSRRIVFTPPHPDECAWLMAELIKAVNENIKRCRAGSPDAPDPIQIAAFACSELITIHPFGQGNGRTARAAANMILTTFGFAPLRFESGDTKPGPVKTLEWYFDRHLSEYYAGLAAARRGNWVMWEGIFTEAVQATMTHPPPDSRCATPAFAAIAAAGTGIFRGISR